MIDRNRTAPDEDWRNGGFGIYLHWPFCASKCPYCDFNSHVATQIDPHRWTMAYLRELDRIAAEVPGRVPVSVFLGGGTPSLMPPEIVAAILDRVAALWPSAERPEVTLEANPGSVELGRFRAYRDAGVNRISIGIQSLRDHALRLLGRVHTTREGRAAVELATVLFTRVSVDLIYARQGQTRSEWRSELLEALALGTRHLSLYQLTIEPGTVFARRLAAGQLAGLPDDELAAALYEDTQAECDRAGLPAYEVSNHAGPGEACAHNCVYWRSGDYAGIGPGAHGRLTLAGIRYASEALRDPGAWLAANEASGSGELPRTVIPLPEHLEEVVMMGLRLREGIDLARLERLTGCAVEPTRFLDLADAGLVCLSGARLACTVRGWLVLDRLIPVVIERLVPKGQGPSGGSYVESARHKRSRASSDS